MRGSGAVQPSDRQVDDTRGNVSVNLRFCITTVHNDLNMVGSVTSKMYSDTVTSYLLIQASLYYLLLLDFLNTTYTRK